MKSIEGQTKLPTSNNEREDSNERETLLTAQSLQGMNYFQLLAYAQDNDRQLLATIQKIKLESLKKNDSDYFFREYNGEIDDKGYLLDKSGNPTTWLPTQIDQAPAIHNQVAEQIKNVVLQQRPELAYYGKSKKSPEVVASPEIAKATLDTIITTEKLQGTIKDTVDYEKLSELPVFDAQYVENLSLDKIEPDTDSERIWNPSTEVQQIEFVPTAAVVGRSMGREWGEEYDDRTGRTQEIVDTINGVSDSGQQTDEIFHLETRTNQRIKLRAFETPSGDIYSVQDGTHRVSGIKAAELSQFPAEVTRNTYPGKITTTDSVLVQRCERLFELGLASGSITEEIDEKGIKKQKIVIESEKYAWLRNTSSNELGQILKTISSVYPDVREAFAAEGVPTEAFDDPQALEHFLSDEETYRRYLDIVKKRNIAESENILSDSSETKQVNENLQTETISNSEFNKLLEQPHAQEYLKMLTSELAKNSADEKVIQDMLYKFLTRRSTLVEQQNARGETDLRWMKEKYQPQSDWYQEAISAVTKSLEESGITVNESSGWFGAIASERQPNVVPEGKFKVYESIAPRDYAAFMQSLPSLVNELRSLGTSNGEKISLKTPSSFLSFITHNDSIVVHCDKKHLQPEIHNIIRAWQQKNNIAVEPRELGRTNFGQDSEKTSFTDTIAEHVAKWLKEHHGNYPKDALAKEALKHVINLSKG